MGRTTKIWKCNHCGHTWQSLKRKLDTGDSFKDVNGLTYPKI
jgi:ribosomal protein L37AE/L43A